MLTNSSFENLDLFHDEIPPPPETVSSLPVRAFLIGSTILLGLAMFAGSMMTLLLGNASNMAGEPMVTISATTRAWWMLGSSIFWLAAGWTMWKDYILQTLLLAAFALGAAFMGRVWLWSM